MKPAPQLDKIDLQLIRTLFTLITERSVSRTALRLGQQQPAVSLALRRLRELTGDPILVRSGTGMVPTDAALQMIEPAQLLMQTADQLFAQRRPFEPAQATQTFRIAASDTLDPWFLPGLVARVQQAAPQARLEIHALSPQAQYAQDLAQGRLDLVVGNWLAPPAELHFARMIHEPSRHRADQRRQRAPEEAVQGFKESGIGHGFHPYVSCPLVRSALTACTPAIPTYIQV